MRDNPSHNYTIMGGMWGAKITSEKEVLWRDLVIEIFNQVRTTQYLLIIMFKFFRYQSTSWDYFVDQVLLSSLVWPVVKEDTMVHDSYLCTQIKGGHIEPFPTKRINGKANFVGSVPGLSHSLDTVPCPLECRPRDHQNWDTC